MNMQRAKKEFDQTSNGTGTMAAARRSSADRFKDALCLALLMPLFVWHGPARQAALSVVGDWLRGDLSALPPSLS